MIRYFIVTGIASCLVAGSAGAQQISRHGFNFNPPPCPGSATVTTNVDKFTDGGPLPSCGGRETHGSQITTYKLVWTGHQWEKYVPSVKTVSVSAPARMPPPMNLAPKASDFRVDSRALGYRGGMAPAPGRTVTYQSRQYQVSQVIAAGGGNVIAAGGGNVIAQGGGNLTVVLKLIGSDGAGVVGPGGASLHR